MGRTEKAIWTLTLLVLLVLELRSITLDQQEHDEIQAKVQCEELNHFDEIAQGVTNATSHVDTVLKTTQDVASLAKENLESITGGKSFAYVVPVTVLSPILPENYNMSWNIMNDGPDILTGVSVSVVRVTKEASNESGSGESTEAGSSTSIGSLAPRSRMTVPNASVSTRLLRSRQNMAHYFAVMTAQNGSTREDIYFRLAASGKGWAYRIRVIRHANGKDQTVKTIDWKEPQILQP